MQGTRFEPHPPPQKKHCMTIFFNEAKPKPTRSIELSQHTREHTPWPSPRLNTTNDLNKVDPPVTIKPKYIIGSTFNSYWCR